MVCDEKKSTLKESSESMISMLLLGKHIVAYINNNRLSCKDVEESDVT